MVPAIAPLLVAEGRSTLCLDGACCTVDALEFRRLARSSPAQAVLLYGGALLKNVDDDWLTGPRAELETLYLSTLESLAERSDAREAVSWLRKAIETDPYSEPLQQKLYSALANCGDFSGLEIAYRRFQDVLHRNLNIHPSLDTLRLFEHLLEGRSHQAARLPNRPPVKSRLPVPATEILGREKEIEDVCALLQSARLVTLLGPGGAGKTRLSVAVGAREEGGFENGIWFTEIALVQESERVVQTLAHTLGFREQSATLAELIGDSQRLLILDNCEHVNEACAAMATTLLAECPNLRILATSRTPLGVHGEQRYPVPPLELPPRLDADIEASREYSALKLFEHRARLVQPSFSVTAANIGQVAAICREVDLLPLGIEMATARLSAFSLAEIQRRLDKQLFLPAELFPFRPVKA